MPKFSDGVIRFQNEIFPEKRALFEKLSEGQSPEALFITCSDSRIETGMLTQCEPGELFVCRNAGNIVPPHTKHTGGVTASVEFASAVLKVPHIIVCGHSGCGAMAAAMNMETVESLPHVREWLQFVKEAADRVKEKAGEKSNEDQLDMLIGENVVLQLEHLKTHPTVAERLEKGDVKLHGWVYDIKTGEVRVYNEERAVFLPFEEYYRSRFGEG